MPGELTIGLEDYRGWPHTYRLDNGLIEVRVVTDVGPRIIDVRRTGGDNLLHTVEEQLGRSGEPEWTFRGGWRLWVAPERRETTYALDNSGCAAEVLDGRTVRVTGPEQPAASIRKQIDVTLVPGEPRVRLTARIRNVGSAPVTYAAWSLPVLRPGGRAFVPLDVGAPTAFDATRRLILWSYTALGDPRYQFGDRLVQIDQRRVAPPPASQTGRRDDESKIGVDSAQGWSAYLLDGTLLLKRFPHDAAGQYPDGGATIEVYSSREFLELEHLGPLTRLTPGEELVLPEDWWLFPDVTIRAGEADALADLQPYLSRTQTP